MTCNHLPLNDMLAQDTMETVLRENRAGVRFLARSMGGRQTSLARCTALFVDVQTFGLVSHVACVSSLHTSNAITGWDLMKLPTMRHTLLTGDVRTVAVLNAMQIASFQMIDR